eukprot:symbB.v1.2.032773.t1/scaffold3975.1/size47066/3
MAAAHDPKLIAHPIAEFFSDLMWERLVSYRVFVGKIYLVFGLLIFILGHALYTDYQQLTDAERVFVFVCRGFNYSATMLQLFIRIIFQIIADIRRGQIVRIYRVPFPKSLCSLREMGYLLLIAALSCCCALEPILWCFNNMEGDFPGSGLFTSTCPEGAAHHDAYSLVAGGRELPWCSTGCWRLTSQSSQCGFLLSSWSAFKSWWSSGSTCLDYLS